MPDPSTSASTDTLLGLRHAARTATGALARHVLGLFLVRWAVLFVSVQGFVGLVAVLRLLARHPYLSVGALASRLPDVLLVFLPVSLPFVVLIAALATVHEARRRRTLLQVTLAGSRPQLAFVPVVVFLCVLCSLLAVVVTAVLPHARFQLAQLAASHDAPHLVAMRLAEDPEFVAGYRIEFDDLADGRLQGVRLVSLGVAPATVIVAQSAAVQRVADSPFLELVLSDGRLLRVTEEFHLDTNLQFESLEIRRDVRALGGPDKTRLINLSYYTGAELERLEALLLYRFQRGIRPTPSQRLRVRGIRAERWTRRASAFTSLLIAALVVALLGRVISEHVLLRTVCTTVLCLVVLLPAQVIFDSAAARGRLGSPWFALAPAALTIAVIAADVAARGLRARRTA